MRFNLTFLIMFLALVTAGCAGNDGAGQNTNQQDLAPKRGVLSDEEAGATKTERTMRMAERAMAEGKPEVAAVFYRTAALADPADPRPRIASADLFEKTGEFAAAAGLYEQLATDKKLTDGWLAAGRNYLKANKPFEATKAYQNALSESPNDPRALNGLAVSYDLRQDHAGAAPLYEKAYDKADKAVKNGILVNWALSLMLAGEAGQAVQKLEPVVADSDSQNLRQTLALAYGLSGRTEDAKRLGLANPPTYDELRATVKEYGMAGPTSGAPVAAPVGDVVTVPAKAR